MGEQGCRAVFRVRIKAKKSKGNKDAENLLRVRREKKSRGNNSPSLFLL